MREEGFDFVFDPNACKSCAGNCCIGESGYIWISPSEIEAVSRLLNISSQSFITSYLSKIGYRYTINEKPHLDGHACVFFDTEKRQCSIYEARPTQCRTFPFWDYFKNHFSEVKAECPGISKV